MERLYFKEVLNMKEMFKKGFGIVMGVYAACCAVNFIDGVARNLVNEVEETSEKEKSDFEEEES